MSDGWSGRGWKRAAREYHQTRGDRPSIVETDDDRLALARRLMEPEVSLEQAYLEIAASYKLVDQWEIDWRKVIEDKYLPWRR